MGNRYKTIAVKFSAAALAVCSLLYAVCSAWGGAVPAAITGVLNINSYRISAAVLYNGRSNDGSWEDTVGYLEQSTLLNLTVGAVDVSREKSFGGKRLGGYDILYLDKSIAGLGSAKTLTAAVVKFAENGGAVFMDNALRELFPPAFLGVSGFVRVTGCPVRLEFPDAGSDIGELQQIIRDFADLYPSYTDFFELSGRDYGWAAICNTATPVAAWKGYALYTLNRYGKGCVFLTSPLLPNTYSLSGFSMQPRGTQQGSFANTTAGCNQLLLSAFAGYAAKQLYGYYLGQVYGSFGSPGMAWELHYEEISAIKHNSMKLFSEMCRDYLQIPSFTLIRCAYRWFRRFETITYYLSGSGGAAGFSPDAYEGVYSSGTHIESGGEWLSFGSFDHFDNYFTENTNFTSRAYPAVCDYNTDGIPDIISGCADGKLYFCQGISLNGRFETERATALTDGKGAALTVGGSSAPCLADINADGYTDIISGSDDGNIYWFSGNGTRVFKPKGKLFSTYFTGQSLPSAGDLNGDGIVDLAVGSNCGDLSVWYGMKTANGVSFGPGGCADLTEDCQDAGLGSWLAPGICDYDGDGSRELAVGTRDGYVALFTLRSTSPAFLGFVTSQVRNYRGNYNLKTGNNCVPVFYDLNADGAADLICGSLEYGLAYPIDSEYFPYAGLLGEQIDYARRNDYYIGAHFYTTAYADEKTEAAELEAQKKAFAGYGLSLAGAGVNQHTWITSRLSPTQTLMSAYKAGFLWDSGFAPSAGAVKSPEASAENVVSLPFYLISEGKPTLLIQNCSVLPSQKEAWTDISARYGMPMCVFYHCDFVYASKTEAETFLGKVSDFWWNKSYNFVKEDQLMKAISAAKNMSVKTGGGNSGESLRLSLTAEKRGTDSGLYDPNFQNAVGAKIVFRQSLDANKMVTDSDVWRVDGNALYIALNKTVSVHEADSAPDTGTHIERVNIPAVLETSPTGAHIRFSADGMMQVVVSGPAETVSPGWTVTARGGKTIFTKYGDPDVLEIVYR